MSTNVVRTSHQIADTIRLVSTKGPYRHGRKDQMTSEWKERARHAIDGRGLSHGQVEDALGAGRGQISRMLSADQNTSVWVAPLSEFLGLPMPGQESSEESELLENFRQASPEGKKAILQHAAASAGISGPRRN